MIMLRVRKYEYKLCILFKFKYDKTKMYIMGDEK